MRYLYGSQVVIALLFIFCYSSTSAQVTKRKNYNYFDFQKKSLYYGLTLGFNSSRYRINHSRDFIGNDSIAVAESGRLPGFDIHVIGNLKIGEYFDFRFLPGFSLSERNVIYRRTQSTAQPRKKIESVFIELPFHVRYKSEPYKDKRAFVIAGLKYTYDVASNSKARQADQLIKISPHDFQLEIGGGVQFFFPYFIFSPEIKLSQGIGNIHIFNDNLNEASVLEKIVSRILTISFHFEG